MQRLCGAALLITTPASAVDSPVPKAGIIKSPIPAAECTTNAPSSGKRHTLSFKLTFFMNTSTLRLGQVLSAQLSMSYLDQEHDGQFTGGLTKTVPVQAVYLGDVADKEDSIYLAVIEEEEEPWIEVFTQIKPGEWYSAPDAECFIRAHNP